MSARKQESQTESVRDAALGYTAIVLGIVCFVLTLVVVMAGVRFIVSLRPVPVVTTGVTTATTSTASTSSAYGFQGMA